LFRKVVLILLSRIRLSSSRVAEEEEEEAAKAQKKEDTDAADVTTKFFALV
jgi:hypothetical protein